MPPVRRSETRAAVASLLTPTCNRGDFLGVLADCIQHQTYPLHLIEWIILDDTPAEAATALARWFTALPLRTRLRRLLYVHVPRKLTIGRKRNLCKALSSGDYCLHMDDDDYYSPRYVQSVVKLFQRYPLYNIVGASEIFFIYPGKPTIWRSGPFGDRHTCGGIMSYTRKYARAHSFCDDATKGEEKQFLNNFREPVLQIRQSYDVYLALAHDTNTVDKWAKTMHRVATPLLWTACVQNHALYAYLRYYHQHSRALAVPPRRRDSTAAIYARNMAAALQLRRHIVHVLVNLLQVASSAVCECVQSTSPTRRSTESSVPIYPRCAAPWYMFQHPMIVHTPTSATTAAVIGELRHEDRAALMSTLGLAPREPL